MSKTTDWNRVSLVNIDGGLAVQRFDEALGNVMANILDMDTEPDKVREIAIIVKFKADINDRKKVAHKLDCKVKLAPPVSVENFMILGQEEGELVGYEQDADQGDLFGEGEE